MARPVRAHRDDVVIPELLAVAARVDGVLVASLSLTDERGGPRCARVKPPVISWRSG
jgi:hypothetical protein